MIRRTIAVLSLLALGAAGLAAADDDSSGKTSKWPHFRLGGVFVGAGYSHYSGYPGFGYPLYGYNSYFYDPFFYGAAVYPGYFYGYGQQAGRGLVKLRSADRSAGVYLDGAFAGQAGKLRDIWLDPGAYDLEVRAANGTSFEQRIYVLSGKSLHIDADHPVETRP